jgi:uncharacterized delta-60 repeat protein
MKLTHGIMRMCVTALLIVSPSVAAAAPGSLDTSFGQGGFVLFPHAAYAAVDVKIQSNGRILVSGDMPGLAHAIGAFSVVRLLPNGHSDNHFGSNGLAAVQFNSGVNDANSMAIQTDGKIVAAGVTDQDSPTHPRAMAIARFMPNGSLDSHFGSNGAEQLIVDGSTNSSAYVALLLPNGKILIGGGATFPSGQIGVVVRLNPNGMVDTSFGDAGVAKTGSAFLVTGLGLQIDGKIVALCGNTAIRLLKNGAVDPQRARGRLVAQAHFGTAMLTPVEKILEALTVRDSQSGNDYDTQAIRLFPDGTNDPSFVSPIFDFLNSQDDIYQNIPFGIALQGDGSVVIAGSGQDENAVDEGALARLVPTGALDLTFGQNGVVASALDGNDQYTAVALQPDGDIVAAGLSFANNGDLVIARYLSR